MCWAATVSVSVCVCVCVPLLQEAKLIPQGLEFLIGLDIVKNLSDQVLVESWFQFLSYRLSKKRTVESKNHLLLNRLLPLCGLCILMHV